MTSAELLTAASFGCSLAALLCAWRLFAQGLLKIYPAFFYYLVSQGVLIAVFSFSGAASRLYALVFIVAYPLTWVLYCLMAREVYNKMFANFPGIAMFGRWSIYTAVIVSAAAALLIKMATRISIAKKASLIVPFESAGRAVVFCLALMLLLLLLVIWRYPLNLEENVVINCGFLSALLTAEAGLLLIEHLTGLSRTLQVDAAMMIFDGCCFFTWGFLLRRDTKERVIRLRNAFKPTEEQRLLSQLDALNGIALRASRK